jgi:hypothetical protein
MFLGTPVSLYRKRTMFRLCVLPRALTKQRITGLSHGHTPRHAARDAPCSDHPSLRKSAKRTATVKVLLMPARWSWE